MAMRDRDMLDEMELDGAEGAADLYEDSFDEMDGMDELDGFDEMDGMDEADGFEASDEFDGFDEYAEAYDEFDESGEEMSLEEIFAQAMEAEDSDEFLRGLGRALSGVAKTAVRVARKAAPVIGRIASAAAPILSAIPLPQAQIAGRLAGMIGNLAKRGASEEEALEALAEVAAQNRAAAPIVAGIAARALLGRAAPNLSPQQRQAVVRHVTQAARVLTAGPRGAAGVRALPRVIRSVRRTAAVRGTSPALRGRVALNTARRIAATPQLLNRLARPNRRGAAIARQASRATPNLNWGGPIGRRGASGFWNPSNPNAASAGGGGCNCGGGGRSSRNLSFNGPVRLTIAPM